MSASPNGIRAENTPAKWRALCILSVLIPALTGAWLGMQVVADVPPNTKPLAAAGSDRTVALGEIVALDASGSTDRDGDRLSYSWSFVSVPDGSGVRLSDPNALRPRFAVDLLGDYVVELSVSDGKGISVADRVVVSTANARPVAVPRLDHAVRLGESVKLDGSASHDPDGDVPGYAWTLLEAPMRSTARLVGSKSAAPTLTPDVHGEYLVQLIVTDGVGASEPALIRLSTANSAPVADAGADVTVPIGRSVRLDGLGSFDPEGGPLEFSWALLYAPKGSAAKLYRSSTPSPVLHPDRPGVYVTQLIVNDGGDYSAADTTVIEVGIAGYSRAAGLVKGGLDTDSDGVLDSSDNCVLVPNADQRDTNNDGFGNVCDADLDNDGVINFSDLGILKTAFHQIMFG